MGGGEVSPSPVDVEASSGTHLDSDEVGREKEKANRGGNVSPLPGRGEMGKVEGEGTRWEWGGRGKGGGWVRVRTSEWPSERPSRWASE